MYLIRAETAVDSDRMVSLALVRLVRLVEIMGEAANHISEPANLSI